MKSENCIVFEQGGRWYELNRNRYNPKRICGARKKTGERCRSKSLHRGGKCKFHGGLSTGARTPEGKARAIAAMQAGRAKWKAQLKLKNNQKISRESGDVHASHRRVGALRLPDNRRG